MTARLLAMRQQELRALVYPLAQVLLGAARLVPAPRYFPLRLRLVGTVRGPTLLQPCQGALWERHGLLYMHELLAGPPDTC